MLTFAISILMVLTSADTTRDGHPTGLWMEEFSAPYEIFLDEGFEVTVASIQGGQVPVDPRSMTAETRPEKLARAQAALATSVPLDAVDREGFDAVFFPGGHGTMFDLPESESVQKTVEGFVNGGRPAAFVCHGPAALVGAKTLDGRPLVAGRRVTGFTNEEEASVELTESVPFLLESRLRDLGAEFVPAERFEENVVVDGILVTGQNPASSAKAARALIELLR